MDNRTRTFGISALTLKLLGIAFMLLDHLWATVWSVPWFALVGRIAFPIFAFQIAEGFFRTSDRKGYMRRLLVFALISEIPFNLVLADSVFYPLHQNVMFTFLIALLLMQWMESKRGSLPQFIGISLVCVLLATSPRPLVESAYKYWLPFISQRPPCELLLFATLVNSVFCATESAIVILPSEETVVEIPFNCLAVPVDSFDRSKTFPLFPLTIRYSLPAINVSV